MSENDQYGGRLKAIQWNNRQLSGFLSVYFLISIVIFVCLIFIPIILAIAIFDPDNLQQTLNSQTFFTKPLRIVIKVFMFCIIGALYFVHKSIKDIPRFFEAYPLKLTHDDPLYRTIETQCISRGLKVPTLFALHNTQPGIANLVTAIVVRDLTGKSSIVFSEGALSLKGPERDALIAQAIQRIHTKDTLFLTLLCFFGFYPFHIQQELGKIRYAILKPALYLTDLILAPMRNWIITLRFARLDAGSLEITKEKGAAAALLTSLSSMDEIRKYYYDAYLPLFIAKSDELYRLKSLRAA